MYFKYKTRISGNTPKYGLIYHSTFIGRAGTKNKGRISRYLANKCSIAARIDCFNEAITNIFGEKLKQQVEDRLKFYETGDLPRTNIEVMKEALEEVNVHAQQTEKKKKRKSEGPENNGSELTEETRKKKKKKYAETEMNQSNGEVKKIKKKKSE